MTAKRAVKTSKGKGSGRSEEQLTRAAIQSRAEKIASVLWHVIELMVGMGLSLADIANGFTGENGKDNCAKLAEAGKQILQGRTLAIVDTPKHLIDQSKSWIPENFTLDTSMCEGEVSLENRDGKLFVNGHPLELFLSEEQKGRSIRGFDLEKKLRDKPVLGTAVLRYLLDHPELIPESWKDKAVFFWGNTLRDASGDRCVLRLYWYDVQWRWGYFWLERVFGGHGPAACRKP